MHSLGTGSTQIYILHKLPCNANYYAQLCSSSPRQARVVRFSLEARLSFSRPDILSWLLLSCLLPHKGLVTAPCSLQPEQTNSRTMMQLQQVQPHPRGQPLALPRSTKRSLAICPASRRNMQQADRQEASSTTTSSNDLQVSIAVPIEQAPPAQQQGQSNFDVIGALAAAAVAAGFIFKKLRSNG